MSSCAVDPGLCKIFSYLVSIWTLIIADKNQG